MRFKLHVCIALTFAFLNFLYISWLLQGGSFGQFCGKSRNTFLSINEVNSLFAFKSDSIYNEFICPITGIMIDDSRLLSYKIKDRLKIREKLALYSLEFLRRPLKTYSLTKNHSLRKRIINTTSILLDHLNSFTLIPDRMKYNDHVISSRIETLILLQSILDDEPSYYLIKESVENEIHKCLINLLDDKKFNFATNHGIMQVRSLLIYASVYKDSKTSKIAIQTGNERLKYLLDYHIANDGSIYESATQYWFYIKTQFEIISSLPATSSENKTKLEERLSKVYQYLHNITNHDGFVQGIGDSYNYDIDLIDNLHIIYNHINGISGFKYHDSLNNTISMMFVSGDNPPNVHKHPEDLSVYIYSNYPLFVNTGIYDYDNSKNRKTVLDQKNQNTVYSQNFKPTSSIITKVGKDSALNKLIFFGQKEDGEIRISRNVEYYFHNTYFNINDSVSSKLGKDNITLYSCFNIHPDVKVLSNKKRIALVKNSDTLATIFSSSKHVIDSTLVSLNMYSISKIQRLTFIGYTNNITIRLQNIGNDFNIDNIATTNNSSSNSKRKIMNDYLSIKYSLAKLFNSQSIKRFVLGRVVFIFVLITLISVCRRNYLSIFVIGLAIYILDIFTSGILLSLTLLQQSICQIF